jgi:DnaJ-class molecular chaperone
MSDYDFEDMYDDEDYEVERTKCLNCKGTGKIPLFVSLSECPACKGLGEIEKNSSQKYDQEFYD